MVEQCKDERGPEPGDRRAFRCAAWRRDSRIAEMKREGWKLIGTRPSPIVGRGLAPMVDLFMEYGGKPDA